MSKFFKDYAPYVLGALMVGGTVAMTMGSMRNVVAQTQKNTGDIRQLERSSDCVTVELRYIREHLSNIDKKIDKLIEKE